MHFRYREVPVAGERAKNSIVVKHTTYDRRRRGAIADATRKLLCDRKVVSVCNHMLLTTHELTDTIQDELERWKWNCCNNFETKMQWNCCNNFETEVVLRFVSPLKCFENTFNIPKWKRRWAKQISVTVSNNSSGITSASVGDENKFIGSSQSMCIVVLYKSTLISWHTAMHLTASIVQRVVLHSRLHNKNWVRISFYFTLSVYIAY